MKRLLILSVLLMVVASASTSTSTPAEPPIVLGVATALGSIEGADAYRAVQMAVEEINASGGVSMGCVVGLGCVRRPLELVAIDTREHEPGIPVDDALRAVEKLILEEEPDAIVLGSFRSEVLLASMDLIAKYKLPYITPIAMTMGFQTKIKEDYDKYKYMFRTGLNVAYFVKYLQEVMGFIGKEFGFNRAYIIAQDVLWAKGTGGALEKWFKEQGWEVVGFDTYPTGATEFSPSLFKVIEGQAQVIVPIFDMPQAGILLKQARAMQVPALLAGFISPVAPGNAWEVFEGEVEGMVNFVFEVGNIPAEAVPESVVFYENYGKRWGEDKKIALSGHGAAPAYDSVYILANAIERAGTLDPEALVKAIEETDMRGAIGRIRFSEDHQVIFGFDPEETAIGAAFQWREPGVRVVVFPEVIAEGKIELPPYMKE